MKPTETGWYWYKFLSKPWAVVYVHSFNGRFGVRGNGRIFWLDEEANGFIECVRAWVKSEPPVNMDTVSSLEESP